MIAMGGSTKVFSSNSNNKGRSYAMMLLMAFGAAIFAIMLLQKFRERRICNLLIKEKDLELFSIHVLLQNERELTKELKKNISELKEKVYSIGTKKINIESQIVEMQHKISSLQDEQNTAESALREKENEITMMRQKETSEDNAQVINLAEMLKQKEAEIEDLKHQRTITTNQPSIEVVNSSDENGTMIQNSIDQFDGLHKKDHENDDMRKMITEQNLRNHIDADKKIEEIVEDKNDNVGIGVENKNNMTNSTAETNSKNKRTPSGKENNETTQGDGHQKILKVAGEREGHEHQITSPILTDKGRRRHGYSSNTRGKRWKTIAKIRKLDHNIDFQLKKSNEHVNRNSGSVSMNKFVQDNDSFGNTVILKSGGELPSKVNGIPDKDGSKNSSVIEKLNVEVEAEKKIPKDSDESSDGGDVRDSDKNVNDESAVHVEPGLEVENDREDSKEQNDVSEF